MVSILETPIGEITLDSVLASAYIMTFRNMLSKMNDAFFHHSNLQTCLLSEGDMKSFSASLFVSDIYLNKVDCWWVNA